VRFAQRSAHCAATMANATALPTQRRRRLRYATVRRTGSSGNPVRQTLRQAPVRARNGKEGRPGNGRRAPAGHRVVPSPAQARAAAPAWRQAAASLGGKTPGFFNSVAARGRAPDAMPPCLGTHRRAPPDDDGLPGGVVAPGAVRGGARWPGRKRARRRHGQPRRRREPSALRTSRRMVGRGRPPAWASRRSRSRSPCPALRSVR
jgi:hypothetical protein